MSDKTFGVGIVGLGMGISCARWVLCTPNARLSVVCDASDERIARCVDEFKCCVEKDFDRMIQRKDVDIVYVVTPSGTHADLGIKAARQGKHVIVAKPMDVCVEKCDELIEACRKAGVLLAVDFNMRFMDVQQKIRYAIDNNLFGKLILGEARLKWFRSDVYYANGGWRGTWKLDGGGSLANQAIHQIDQLQWFMGELHAVTAAEIGVFAHAGVETEDLGMAMLRFKNGAVGTILGTTTFPIDAYAGIEIHGTEGGVLATQGEPRWFFKDENRLQQLQRATSIKTTIEDMVSVLNGHTDKLCCDGIEGRKSIEVLTAVYRAAGELAAAGR
jgi:UDP-N-acetyl-2-amino-2-deoxyglucuronate dehydrogenase